MLACFVQQTKHLDRDKSYANRAPDWVRAQSNACCCSIVVMGSSSAVELLRANKAAEALPLLQAEVAARPEDSLSFEYLSLGLAQLQRFPEAETASASAARLSPRSAAIWFNLGNAQREQRGREQRGSWLNTIILCRA